MATGMARGAAARGKRIAFGDGRQIIWDPHSEIVFRGNPNVARPGDDRADDIEWIAHYKGHRLYNHRAGDRWVWNFNFRARPGEMFFSEQEIEFGRSHGKRFVVIEPNVPEHKGCAPNKQWPVKRYDKLATRLASAGYDVRQLHYGARHKLGAARQIRTRSFREALAVLSNAALYIGPEGGLHHGAAAVGIPAVVIFGGFIPPQVTGYDTHTNLTGGTMACGSLTKCRHCIAAMEAIPLDDVQRAAMRYLENAA